MNNGTAVVTGASSGIGAVYARRLAARGYNIIAHGRREELLRFLCGELRERYNVRADYVVAELSDHAQLASLERTIRDTPDLAFLVNNAGHGTMLTFHEESVQSQDGMVRTHVNATVRLTHAAIPAMLSRGSGTIVNVSSVAGFLISPGSAIYCATKAFLNSFSESLHLELRGTGIRVQALCPGFTTSDFHKRLGYDTTQPSFRRFMPAERVVDASLVALERGTVVCIPGWQYKFAALAGRWMPRRTLYRIVLLRRKIGKRVLPSDGQLSV
jgi:uncharacterized protein